MVIIANAGSYGPSSTQPSALVDAALPELCIRPEAWSWEERPIATQSSPDSGLVLTHYRDTRTIRVHSLSWSFATAAERAFVLQTIPTEIGAMSARFRWRTPDGEEVAVTVTTPPTVSRVTQSTGSISMRLEEDMIERIEFAPVAGRVWFPGLFYTSEIVA